MNRLTTWTDPSRRMWVLAALFALLCVFGGQPGDLAAAALMFAAACGAVWLGWWAIGRAVHAVAAGLRQP